MRTLLYRIATAVGLSAGLLVPLAITASPAAAALPHCTSYILVHPFWGTEASLPSHNGSIDCVLGPGDGPNNAVQVLQAHLDQCNGVKTELTRVYDQRTRDGVTWIQAIAVNNGAPIAVDGWYGPQTRYWALKVSVWDMYNPGGFLGCHHIRI